MRAGGGEQTAPTLRQNVLPPLLFFSAPGDLCLMPFVGSLRLLQAVLLCLDAGKLLGKFVFAGCDLFVVTRQVVQLSAKGSGYTDRAVGYPPPVPWGSCRSTGTSRPW